MNTQHIYQVMRADPEDGKVYFLKTTDFDEAHLAYLESISIIKNSPCTYTGNDEAQYRLWEMGIEEYLKDVTEYGIQPKEEVVA